MHTYNSYDIVLTEVLRERTIENLPKLGKTLLEITRLYSDAYITSNSKYMPCRHDEIKKFIKLRRDARNTIERKQYSKLLWKKLRTANRRWQTSQIKAVLEEFQDLDRLHQIHHKSIEYEKSAEYPKDLLNDLFRDIYNSEHEIEKFNVEQIRKIKQFNYDEFRHTLRDMKNRRCADRDGLIIETIKYVGRKLKETILNLYNKFILNADVCE